MYHLSRPASTYENPLAGLARDRFVGHVHWSAAPDLVFKLEVTMDGRVAEFSARAESGETVTARRLRQAPIGAMERAVRKEVRDSYNEGAEMFPPGSDIGRHARATAASFSDHPRPGAAGRKDIHYLAVAEAYVRAFDNGDPHPVKSVAAQLTLSTKTVGNRLYEARERGLLTSVGRGRAGGHLTDKAKELLSGHNQAP